MSHSHERALADKQNVFHAFSKHFKPRGDSCSPMNLCTSNHISSSRHDKNTDTQYGQKHKIKRRKKRRERSHLRDGDRGGSKIRSQSHCHHQHRKEKAQCHDLWHISSRPPPRKDAPFSRVFPTAQEPSIITDNRLIGHHGLFNHEVKSFDIERLLSEQRQLEKLGPTGFSRADRRQQKSDGASLPPPLTSPQLPFSPVPDCVSTTEEARDKTRAERTTVNTKTERHECKTHLDSSVSCGDTREDVGRREASAQVHLEEEEISASHNNSQGADLTSGQRQKCQGSLTSDSEAILLPSTDTSNAEAAKRTELRLLVSEMGEPLPPREEPGNSRPQDARVNALTLEKSPQNTGFLQSNKKPCGPSPKLAWTSDRREASESAEPQQTGAARRRDPVSAVAARLCQSLELPLLRRRHLLAESRGVLLRVLRERHGSQLQENLLKAQRCLSFSSTPAATRHGRSSGPAAGEEEDGVWPADISDSGSGEAGAKQRWRDPERAAGLRRRRKQLCPLRVSPPLTHREQCPLRMSPALTHREPAQGLNLSVPWASSPGMEQAEDPFGEIFTSPSCSHFPMDIQPSGAMFAPPPASYWGPAFPPQPPSEGLNRGTRERTSMNCFETWRYDTDRSLPNQAGEMRERSTGCSQIFQQFLARLPEGYARHLPQRADPFEVESSHFSSSDVSSSALAQRSLESRQLHPFYRSNRRPPSPAPSPCSPGMACYPPSHMLEGSLSPTQGFLPAFPSPERWAFPRMRLY